jgi:hypothetical protein
MNPLAQVAHVKSRLSAAGEYVPTVREFERHLRDVGCSQKVAKVMISKLFDDDDSNGMLPGQPRDVVQVEDLQAVEAARAVLERIQLASLKLPKFA